MADGILAGGIVADGISVDSLRRYLGGRHRRGRHRATMGARPCVAWRTKLEQHSGHASVGLSAEATDAG